MFKFIQTIPNQNCLDYDKQIQNVIFLSKIPDETNVVIVSDKKVGETSPGILTTENISEELKDEAGNIIKALKSQNLI